MGTNFVLRKLFFYIIIICICIYYHYDLYPSLYLPRCSRILARNIKFGFGLDTMPEKSLTESLWFGWLGAGRSRVASYDWINYHLRYPNLVSKLCYFLSRP